MTNVKLKIITGSMPAYIHEMQIKSAVSQRQLEERVYESLVRLNAGLKLAIAESERKELSEAITRVFKSKKGESL